MVGSAAYRGSISRIIGARCCGRARPVMSTKIRYRDEPLGEIRVVPDFVPSPAQLAFRDEGVKVTLALSRKSVDFFKAEASRHHTQYQRMIRRLLDAYVERQPQDRPSGSPRAARGRAARKRTAA